MPSEKDYSQEGIDQVNEASPVPASPVPIQAKTVEMLDFTDALREVLNGKRVTRVSWDDKDIFVYILGEFLSINMGDSIHQLIVSVGDMQGLDWYVLPEEGEQQDE